MNSFETKYFVLLQLICLVLRPGPSLFLKFNNHPHSYAFERIQNSHDNQSNFKQILISIMLYKSSLLDHVYSTDCASISNIKSLKPVLWDQLLIHFDMNIPKSEAIQSLRRDYRKYSKESLSGMLSEITRRTGVERFSITVIFLKICGDTKIIFILYTK